MTVDIVIATYTINDDRKKLVNFAGPYLRARQDIMVKAGDNSIEQVTCTAAHRLSRSLRYPVMVRPRRSAMRRVQP